ncbi:MAG: DUF58 domain-containing protein [Planctomycetaceae bacterium]|nr:DUF58 domain-containing protein [Planctomycetaceae bacterium]
MRRLHHMTITREGVAYLVVMGIILTAAVIRQINLLMLLYGVLAGPLLLSWRLVRRTLKQLDVARKLPPAVFADEPFKVELEVKNGKTRGGSFAVTVAEEIRKRGENRKPFTAEAYFPYVPAGGSQRGSYQLTLPARGIYDFQPLKISTRFPLGLLRTMLRLDKPQKLQVLPRLGKLAPLWQRLWRADEETARSSRRRDGTQEGDFYGLREFRSGDSRNRIHWRTSARRQTLTVRQYERKQRLLVVLIVDLWLPESSTPEERRRLELVISFAATLAAEICREPGRDLLLQIVGKQQSTLRGSSSPQLLQESLQALAAAEPTRDDRLPAVLESTFGQLHGNGNALVVGLRSNDLASSGRLADVVKRPELRTWANRMACLSPDDLHWNQLFQIAESR